MAIKEETKELIKSWLSLFGGIEAIKYSDDNFMAMATGGLLFIADIIVWLITIPIRLLVLILTMPFWFIAGDFLHVFCSYI